MMDHKVDRPLVKDLLEEHGTKIEEIRAIIEKEDSYCKSYVDIWMLRFILSHKKVSKASIAAIKTMKFRQEKKLNELVYICITCNIHINHLQPYQPPATKHLKGTKLIECRLVIHFYLGASLASLNGMETKSTSYSFHLCEHSMSIGTRQRSTTSIHIRASFRDASQ